MITLYTTPTCHYCHEVKAFLEENGQEFKLVDVTKDRDSLNLVKEKTGRLAVPVTQIGDEFIVGFEEERISQLLGI